MIEMQTTLAGCSLSSSSRTLKTPLQFVGGEAKRNYRRLSMIVARSTWTRTPSRQCDAHRRYDIFPATRCILPTANDTFRCHPPTSATATTNLTHSSLHTHYTCMESHFLHNNNKTNKLSHGFGYSWDVRRKYKSQKRAQKQSQTNGNNKNRMATKEIKRRKTRAHQRNSGNRSDGDDDGTNINQKKELNGNPPHDRCYKLTTDIWVCSTVFSSSSLARSHFFAFFLSLFFLLQFVYAKWLAHYFF